jgi:hypothetical protein
VSLCLVSCFEGLKSSFSFVSSNEWYQELVKSALSQSESAHEQAKDWVSELSIELVKSLLENDFECRVIALWGR